MALMTKMERGSYLRAEFEANGPGDPRRYALLRLHWGESDAFGGVTLAGYDALCQLAEYLANEIQALEAALPDVYAAPSDPARP